MRGACRLLARDCAAQSLVGLYGRLVGLCGCLALGFLSALCLSFRASDWMVKGVGGGTALTLFLALLLVAGHEYR